MNFAIRFLTEYRYDTPVTDNLNALRVRPATTSTQRCDEFHARIDPEARVQPPPRLLRHRGASSSASQPHEHLTIDVRARVVTSGPPEPPEGAWESLHSASYTTRPASSLLPWQDQPRSAASTTCTTAREARQPAGDPRHAVRAGPRPLRVPAAARPTSARPSQTCSKPARACARTSCTSSLVLLRRRGIAARYVSGYLWSAPRGRGRGLRRGRHARVARRRYCRAPAGAASQCGSAPTRPTAASRARRT